MVDAVSGSSSLQSDDITTKYKRMPTQENPSVNEPSRGTGQLAPDSLKPQPRYGSTNLDFMDPQNPGAPLIKGKSLEWGQAGASTPPPTTPPANPPSGSGAKSPNDPPFTVPKGLDGLAFQGDNGQRDLLRASGLLDGQLDALGKNEKGEFNGKGNTFITHEKDGKTYLAYKSDLNGDGDIRHGQIEIGPDGKPKGDQWTKPDGELTDKLDKAHTKHMDDVKNHGSIENYREAEQLRRDLREFNTKVNDLNGNERDGNQRDGSWLDGKNGFGELSTKLEALRAGDEKISAKDLRAKFNDLLDTTGNEALKEEFLNGRKNDIVSELDKDTVSKEITREGKVSETNAKLDSMINDKRDKKQYTGEQEYAKFDNVDMKAFQERVDQLKNLDTAGLSPERQAEVNSLKKISENLINSTKTEDAHNKLKYHQGELAYLNSKFDALGALAKPEPATPEPAAPGTPKPDPATKDPEEGRVPLPKDPPTPPAPPAPPAPSGPGEAEKAEEAKKTEQEQSDLSRFSNKLKALTFSGLRDHPISKEEENALKLAEGKSLTVAPDTSQEISMMRIKGELYYDGLTEGVGGKVSAAFTDKEQSYIFQKKDDSYTSAIPATELQGLGKDGSKVYYGVDGDKPAVVQYDPNTRKYIPAKQEGDVYKIVTSYTGHTGDHRAGDSNKVTFIPGAFADYVWDVNQAKLIKKPE